MEVIPLFITWLVNGGAPNHLLAKISRFDRFEIPIKMNHVDLPT